MANEELDLLSLNKKHFTKIFFNEFREIGSEIYKNALKRKLRIAKIYKEAVEYCKKENIGAINQLHSLSQRSSMIHKKKNSFQAQISMAKDIQSSLKESEVFNASYKSYPKHTIDLTNRNDRHFKGQITHLKSKIFDKDIENNLEGNNNDSLQNLVERINKESGEDGEKNKKKKGGYYEKFTSMLAQSPLITKNYIPFVLDNNDSNMRKVDESIKKVDDLQEKITKMDKNMEDVLKVFNELGMAFQND